MPPHDPSRDRVFRFDRLRHIRVFAPLFVLVAAGVAWNWQAFSRNTPAILALALLIVVLTTFTIAGPYVHFLKLSCCGLTVRYPFHTVFYRWDEVLSPRLADSQSPG